MTIIRLDVNNMNTMTNHKNNNEHTTTYHYHEQ